MEYFSYYLIYEMIAGSALGYINDTHHNVPREVRKANLAGRIVNKTLIQLGWKGIEILIEILV